LAAAGSSFSFCRSSARGRPLKSSFVFFDEISRLTHQVQFTFEREAIIMALLLCALTILAVLIAMTVHLFIR
jgi:hypothetical protein